MSDPTQNNAKLRFKSPFERLSNVDEVLVIQVVKVKSLVGEGDEEGSPKRHITEYFSLDGELLARRDKYIEPTLEQGIWNHDSKMHNHRLIDEQ